LTAANSRRSTAETGTSHPTKLTARIEQIEESMQRYLDALETADRAQPVEVEAKTKRLT
jgi:hypothetical protein